jgi:hypothetical protein
MAKEESVDKIVEQASSGAGMQVFADALAKAVAELAPRKFVQFGRHDARTVFNPTGKRNRQLTRPTFQNGYRVQVDTCSDEEIALFDQLKPGSYLNKLIRVILIDDQDGGQLHINYPNKTADQRMQVAAQVTGYPGAKTGFESMLRKIVAEQEQNKIDAKAARKREIEEALE